MTNTPSKLKTFLIASFLVFLGACAEPTSTSSNDHDISVKVYEGLTGSCDNSTGTLIRMGDGPGQRTATTYTNNSCGAYIVDISGNVGNAESVVLNIDGSEISLTVAADGTLKAQIGMDISPSKVTVTPVENGTLGASFQVTPVTS